MTQQMVRYYIPQRGWHVGYLVQRGPKWAKVRRILPFGVQPKKRGHLYPFVTVPVGNVELLRGR